MWLQGADQNKSYSSAGGEEIPFAEGASLRNDWYHFEFEKPGDKHKKNTHNNGNTAADDVSKDTLWGGGGDQHQRANQPEKVERKNVFQQQNMCSKWNHMANGEKLEDFRKHTVHMQVEHCKKEKEEESKQQVAQWTYKASREIKRL